ncbi:hypothetical protein Hanom_Chr05g00386431 [Helianthus anomalus]
MLMSLSSHVSHSFKRFLFIFSHTLLFAIICNPNYLCLPHSLYFLFCAFHLLPLIVCVGPHQHLSLQRRSTRISTSFRDANIFY